MFKAIRTATLSALIAVGSIAAFSAPASAADLRIVAGSGGIYLDVGDRNHGRHYRGHNRHRGICAPGQAVNKASRHGLRRAHIVRRTPRSVTVAGRDRGYRTITFANVRGCPRIR